MDGEGFTFLSERVQVENPIVFGSNVPRKMFPIHTAPDRMGIEMGLRGAPHRGPGLHQPHPITLFLYPLNTRPKSKKGWYFGCRTGLRSQFEGNKLSPGPSDYQKVKLDTPHQSGKPFGKVCPRFSSKDYQTISPGPGRYDNYAEPSYQFDFHYAFGGKKKLKETARIKCTKGIPEECSGCGCNLIGDYYESKLRNEVICLNCYNKLKSTKADPMKERKLQQYTKARDCGSIHKHDFPGFSPKQIIRSDKEIKKLKQKEAYFRIYFSE